MKVDLIAGKIINEPSDIMLTDVQRNEKRQGAMKLLRMCKGCQHYRDPDYPHCPQFFKQSDETYKVDCPKRDAKI